MMKESTFQRDSSHLLKQLEDILQCDTLIDEVGFIHPSQFVELNQDTSNSFDVNMEDNNTMFWNRDHKLAISTQALFPLYTAARHAFMTAMAQYKMLLKLPRKEDDSMNETSSDSSSFSEDFLECEIMKHSKALLLLSCDFTTAWNSRKLIVSKKQNFSQFLEELLLSALVLSYSPKSEHAWSHRRWVIKTISGRHSNLQEILEKESELVEKIAEKSKMNYRAWNHRCWLVSYMKSRQVLDELNKSKKWAQLHVADNCCFHYRQQLLIRMLEQGFIKHGPDMCLNSLPDLYHVWKEELDWDEMLIKRYIGREALWVHRRFLSQYWVNHFALVQDAPIPYQDDVCIYQTLSTFMDDELQLLHTCLTLPNNDFEDGDTQAVLAVAYILWVSKQLAHSEGIKVQEKLRELGDLKTLLNNLCPEKTLLWNGGLIGWGLRSVH